MASRPVLPDFIPRSVDIHGGTGDQGEACAGVELASVAQAGLKEEGGEVGKGEHLYAPPLLSHYGAQGLWSGWRPKGIKAGTGALMVKAISCLWRSSL